MRVSKEKQEGLVKVVGFYGLPFLPDLTIMALYTLILVLVYRRNRSAGFSYATMAPASSWPSFPVWSILRILFTLFLSGFEKNLE